MTTIPKTRMRRAVPILCAAAVLATCSSCDNEGLPVYQVQGQVVADGQPAANAFLIFHPEEGSKELQTVRPHGRADGDGYFTLSTYGQSDGAPAGTYRVTVEWPTGIDNSSTGDPDPEQALSGPDRLRGKYADVDSTPLRITIVPDVPDLPVLELEP